MEDLKKLILWVAQTGSTSAYDIIVRRFQDMAVGYAYSVLGDFHLAEDAAQEAFIEAFDCLPKLREPNAFPAWFRRIIFKQCDRLTRGMRLETVPIETVLDQPLPGREVLDVLIEREAKENLLKVIEVLPDAQRQAVTLFYISGYSQGEIADFLDVPISTINSRLQLARKRLLATLSDERQLEMAKAQQEEQHQLQSISACGSRLGAESTSRSTEKD